MRIASLAAFLVLLALPLATLEADWTQVEGDSFTVFSDAGIERAVQIEAQLEQLVGVLEQLFPENELRAPVPVYTFLFASPESFAPYRPLSSGQPLEVPGYLVPAEYGVFAALLGSDPDAARRTVYKQYLQYLLHAHLPTLPSWLATGVAELYATFAIEGDEALIGLPPEPLLQVLVPAADHLVPAELFLSRRSDAELSAQDDVLVTAQSWAIAHFLFTGDASERASASRFVRSLADGDDPAAALERTMGLTPAELDTRLAEYVRQESFDYLRVPVTMAPSSPKRGPLPAGERHFRLGTLLLQLGPDRANEATEQMRLATQLDPQLGWGWAGLGFATERAGQTAEALPLYAKAAELSPDEALVQLLYGEGLLTALGQKRPTTPDEQTTLDAASEAFRRSAELDPGSAQSWARLGYAGNLQPKPVDGTTEALARAAELMPSRVDVAYNQVLDAGRRRDREAAEHSFERMRRLDADEASLARAREVLLQLDYAEAVELVYAEKTEDAIGLLIEIATLTTNPAVRDRAEDQLGRLDLVERHNEFARLYREAVIALGSGDHEAARSKIQPLRELARPGRQEEVVTALAAEIERSGGG